MTENERAADPMLDEVASSIRLALGRSDEMPPARLDLAAPKDPDVTREKRGLLAGFLRPRAGC